MEVSYFLTQFWGWMLVILGSVLLLRGSATLEELFKKVKTDQGFVILSGYLALILGLVTVLLHNVWSADGRVVVTLLGWMSLVKGVVRIGFPQVAQQAITSFKSRLLLTRVLLIVCILLGVWLIEMSL